MNEDKLMQRIDELVREYPHNVEAIEESAKALQRRFDDVFNDLGLNELAPSVKVLPGAGYEVVVEFPTLGRRWADRMLRRLEDIEGAMRQPVAQMTSRFFDR